MASFENIYMLPNSAVPGGIIPQEFRCFALKRVRSARNLLCKGKNNTNNCFVTIALGKEKYQTSVKEKAEANVTWNEACELKIPDQGNRAELSLTCLHRNNLGLDEFLGQVTLPLNEMDAYDRPRAKWHKLESKPGKEKSKDRGELEVLISFTVKSGSLTDLSKKKNTNLPLVNWPPRGSSKRKQRRRRHVVYRFFASIGTPNRARVPDSEDEDDFQFDKLSQKSS
ncbi:Rab11 family-interacting protein 5, partial [Eumeta japonica]